MTKENRTKSGSAPTFRALIPSLSLSSENMRAKSCVLRIDETSPVDEIAARKAEHTNASNSLPRPHNRTLSMTAKFVAFQSRVWSSMGTESMPASVTPHDHGHELASVGSFDNSADGKSEEGEGSTRHGQHDLRASSGSLGSDVEKR